MTTNIFEKTFNVLEQTKTNFSVKKVELVSIEGHKTESFGVFRTDNGSCLGTVKGRYLPMQNANLVELLLQATETLNLDVTNGGTLKGGARVFYQIGLTDEFIGNSSVKRNITALNTHDGTGSIGFGSTNTVVICQNTFFKAYKDNAMQKVRHTTNSAERLNQLVLELKQQLSNDEQLMTTFKRMADVQLKDEMVERVIKKLFAVNPNQNTDEISTRKKNQVVAFADSLKTEMSLEGNTVWGLFNAVTRYTNHVASPKDEQRKTDYLMNGQGAVLSNLAFNELLNFVNLNSTEYVMINA